MIENFSKAFYTALTANAALNTKLGVSGSNKKVYNTIAPQTASLPYLVYGILIDMPIGTFKDLAIIESMTFYINCFSSTSVIDVMQIADLIKTAMDNVILSITGYTALICMREYIGNVNYDIDNKVYQITMRYKVQGSK